MQRTTNPPISAYTKTGERLESCISVAPSSIVLVLKLLKEVKEFVVESSKDVYDSISSETGVYDANSKTVGKFGIDPIVFLFDILVLTIN